MLKSASVGVHIGFLRDCILCSLNSVTNQKKKIERKKLFSILALQQSSITVQKSGTSSPAPRIVILQQGPMPRLHNFKPNLENHTDGLVEESAC